MLEIFYHCNDKENSFNDKYDLLLDRSFGPYFIFAVKRKQQEKGFIYRMKLFLKMTVNDILELEDVELLLKITVYKRLFKLINNSMGIS